MSRIFTALAFVSIALLCITVGLGLSVGDYNPLYKSLRDTETQLRQQRLNNNTTEITRLEGEVERIYGELQTPRRRARFHMLVAILSSLVAILVNSISVTYFIGTSRWCKEVVDTYGLDDEMVSESARLKRRSFPYALAGMLVIVIIVALGAASDPGTLRETTHQWVLPHFSAALGGAAFIALSFHMQASYIRRNTEIVDTILDQVRDVRSKRGLDVE